MFRERGVSRADRPSVVSVLVASSAKTIESSSRTITRGLIQNGPEESTNSLVLPWPVACAIPVSSQKRLTDIVRGVVGDVVFHSGAREQRQLADAFVSSGEECGRTCSVCGYRFDSPSIDEDHDGRQLRRREWSHGHGDSPSTGTIGPLRTLVKKPDCACASAGVSMVALTGRRTTASTLSHAW